MPPHIPMQWPNEPRKAMVIMVIIFTLSIFAANFLKVVFVSEDCAESLLLTSLIS
jgi:hypothetical protein